ncbi:polyprenyl synthetase family protein [Sphingomonas quercus]|nr:polyprenyl synthetase family protein [Sphingomonas quercus]
MPLLDDPEDQLQHRLARLRRDVDALLTSLIPETGGPAGQLNEAMRYAVVGGGKRFRAMLTVAVAELVGAPYEQALRVAAAVECVHAQSLVHDDLPCMDDDDMRRGRLTLHRRFDEATAVLSGDALLALAFEILGDAGTHPDAGVRIALVVKLARAIGNDGLAAGQMMDLYPPAAPSPAHVMECEAKKTGGLIRFAVEAGAMLGHCTAEDRASLLRFADSLGLAFQIRDDLLDRTGDATAVGKKLRKDERAGRRNAVATFGLGRASARASQLARHCRDELSRFGRTARTLNDIAEFAVCRSS